MADALLVEHRRGLHLVRLDAAHVEGLLAGEVLDEGAHRRAEQRARGQRAFRYLQQIRKFKNIIMAHWTINN